MATIKAYTDLEQSKKLAEILPLESADMSWVSNGLGKPFARTIPIKGDPEELCACWSLAALLGVLPKVINNETLFIETSPALWHIGYRNVYTARTDNAIDCCVNMILKLHEKDLL